MSRSISRFILSTGLVATSMFAAPAVFAQCAAPVSIEGGINYDSAADTLNVCDGTNWLTVGPGGSNSDRIEDANNNTYIDVDPDDDGAIDRMNFVAGGNQRMLMDANGIMIGATSDNFLPTADFINPGGANYGTFAAMSDYDIVVGCHQTGSPSSCATIGRSAGFVGARNGNEWYLEYRADSHRFYRQDNALLFGIDPGTVVESNIFTMNGDLAVGDEVYINTGTQEASAVLQADSTTQGFLPPRNADPSGNIGTPATGLIAYDSTDNELQFYNGSAWVTIGTTAAGDNLGNHTATTNIQLGTNWLSSDGDSEGLRIQETTGNVLVQLTSNSDEELHIGPEAGTSTDTAISMENNGNTFELHVQDDNLFRITDAAETANWFTLDGATGNIGIGNTAPDTMLHVGAPNFTSEGGTHELLIAENGAGQPNMYFLDSGNDGTSMGIANDDYFAIAAESSQSGIQFKVNGDWTTDLLNTSGVAMTIQTNGNVVVGTGTADADAALDVNGTNKGFLPPRNANPDGNIGATSAGLIAYDSTDNELQFYNGSAWVTVATGAGVTPDSLDWSDFTDSMTLDATTTINMDTNAADLNFDSNTFVIDSSENFVGIGTATPNHYHTTSNGRTLEIRSTHANGSAELLLSSGNNSTGARPQINFGIDTTHVGYIQSRKITTGATASHIVFGTHDGTTLDERMRLAATGELGIGTNTPTTDVHVYDGSGVGAIAVEGDESSISGLALHTTGDGATLLGSGVGSTGWLWEAKGSAWATADERRDLFLSYWDGSTWDEWMFVSHDTGDIGLGGNIDPAVTLDVTGTIKMGDGGESCDASREGSMRYDATGDTFYFCATTASGWEAISLGSGVNAIDDLSDAASDATSVFLGSSAGANDDGTANNNTSIGISTLNANTDGYNNTAVGYRSLITNSSGYRNTAVGMDTLYDNTTGYQNTAIGEYALAVNTEGYQNTAIGQNAMSANLTGDINTAVGYQAGSSITTGDNNILIGSNINPSGATVSNQLNIGDIFFGNLSTDQIGMGVTDVTAINANAALDITSLDKGLLPPRNADPATNITGTAGLIAYDTTDNELQYYNGSAWVAAGGGGGGGAINDLSDGYTDAQDNLALGLIPGSVGANNLRNVSVGPNSLGNITNTGSGGNSGDDNTVVGAYAAQDLTTGYRNTYVGSYAGEDTTTGYLNTAIGYAAMWDAPGVHHSVAIGDEAMATNTGAYNTAIGTGAMSQGSGDSNIAIGQFTLSSLTSGVQNIAIGSNAGSSTTTGGYNILIGDSVTASSATADDELNIGNLIYGDLANSEVFLDAPAAAPADGDLANGQVTFWVDATNDEIELKARDSAGDIINATIGSGGGASAINDLSDATTDYATDFNLFMGDNAGVSIASGGQSNLAIGQNSGDAITTGDNNITLGHNAGTGITTNSNIIAIGREAGPNMGSRSIAIGTGAGFQSPSDDSIFIGTYAGYSPSLSWGNIALGYSALYGGGQNTVAIGHLSANGVYNASDPIESVFIGTRTAQNITSGDNNIFIGYQVGDVTTTGSSNIVIGHDLDPSSATASNELNIGGLIHGDLANSEVFLDAPAAAPVDGDLANGQVTFWVDATNDEIEMKAKDSAGDVINVTLGAGGGGGLWTDLTGGRIHYGTSSANQIGLGTNNPGYTLDVNGDINLPVGNTIRAGGNEMLRMIAPNDGSGVHAIVIGTNSPHTNLGAGTGFNQWEAPGVYIGDQAGNSIDSTSGGSQAHVFIGKNAGQNVTTNTHNTIVGAYSGDGNNVGFGVTVLGAAAGRNAGQSSIYIGRDSGGNDSINLGTNNVVVGTAAGQDSVGSYNAFIGDSAGREQRGADNVAIGTDALRGVDTTSIADNNIAIGRRAMDAVTTSGSNIAIGMDAAGALIDGSGVNVFIGHSAGSGVNTSSAYRNVSIGAFSGQAAGLGNHNSFFGERAGRDATGDNNTFIGRSAGQEVATGDDNVVLGVQPESGQTFTSGSRNILIGANVDTPTATANDYLSIGDLIYGDLANNEVFLDAPAAAPADSDLANGQVTFWVDAASDEIELKARDSAGDIINVTVGSGGGGGGGAIDDLSDAETDYVTDFNMFMGSSAGASIASGGQHNLAIGQNAGDAITTGDRNIALGYDALTAATTVTDNIAIGYNAGAANDTMNGMIAIGYNAAVLHNPSVGGGNIAIGNLALRNATDGYGITAIGNDVMKDTGSTGGGVRDITAIGSGVLENIGQSSASEQTVGLGNVAGIYLRGGDDNTLLGSRAGRGNFSNFSWDGDDNVFIGKDSGLDLDNTNNQNTVIGSETAASLAGGSGNILLGYGVDVSSATVSNELNIGNLIYGDLANSEVFLDAPAAAPVDGDLANGQVTFWVDATNDEIELKAKDSAGDVINVTLGAGGGATELDGLTDATTDYTTDLNLFIGEDAGAAIASGGQYNTLIGIDAGDSLTTGDESVVIGRDAGQSMTVQGYSTIIGHGAAVNWTGSSEFNNLIAIGHTAAGEQNNGFNNVVVGNTAMNLGGGDRNTVMGTNAAVNGTGLDNVIIGEAAAADLDGGDYNVIIGQNAANGQANEDVSYNVIIGENAASGIATGANNNIIIGQGAADALTTGANNIIIGSANNGVDVSASTVSNELNIGGAIIGDLSNDHIGVAGNTAVDALFSIGPGSVDTSGGTHELLISDVAGQPNILFSDTGNDESAMGIASDDYFAIATEDSQSGIQFKTNAVFTNDMLNTGTVRMTIETGGDIGIGITNPNVALDVSGDIEYTGTITDVSDRRLKDNIEPLSKHESLIKKINAIDTYSFTMKDDEDGKTEFGVMAQELEKIFPELVRTADDEMGTKSVNYVGLIAPMIEATKELKSENDALRAEINDIKEDVAGMKLHTGYDIQKANIQNLAMMLVMMLFGGACVIVMNRLGRKS